MTQWFKSARDLRQMDLDGCNERCRSETYFELQSNIDSACILCYNITEYVFSFTENGAKREIKRVRE